MLTDGLILSLSSVKESRHIHDTHEARLLSYEILPLFSDSTGQTWSGKLKIRGFSRVVDAYPFLQYNGGFGGISFRMPFLCAFFVDEAVLLHSLYSQSALSPYGSMDLQLLCVGLWDTSSRTADFPPDRRIWGLLLKAHSINKNTYTS